MRKLSLLPLFLLILLVPQGTQAKEPTKVTLKKVTLKEFFAIEIKTKGTGKNDR